VSSVGAANETLFSIGPIAQKSGCLTVDVVASSTARIRSCKRRSARTIVLQWVLSVRIIGDRLGRGEMDTSRIEKSGRRKFKLTGKYPRFIRTALVDDAVSSHIDDRLQTKESFLW
jgi:hypothetical protein